MNDENKKYLNLGHKLAYSSGDFGTNFCYTFISSFILIYLTNQIGLNSGVIGTLMLLSRVLDGISDVAAGTIIDRTHSRLGKARFWVIVTIPLVALFEILLFCIPSASQTVQYAYFFIIYTILNDAFYTMNNVAYSTMSMFITANKNERVQLGAFRFIGTTIAGTVVNSATIKLVEVCGGGVQGWRFTAIIYSILFVIFLVICVLPLKELPTENGDANGTAQNNGLIANIRYLLRNRFFIQQLAVSILSYVVMNITGAVGIFYMTYILGDESLLGAFSMTMMAMVLGLMIAPFLTSRFGIYKTNLYTMVIVCVMDIFLIIAAAFGNVPLMVVFTALRWLMTGPFTGNNGALTAEISKYTLLKEKAHIEASAFACNSMGAKIGVGLGLALSGWLLDLGGFQGTAQTQTDGALGMISFMYIWIPLLIHIATAVILAFMKVEEANGKLEQES